MKSHAKNKLFANEVSRIAINAGTELHIARNCIRWRNANVSKSIPQKKDYTYGLSPEKLMGPMVRKIQFGTNPKLESKWDEKYFKTGLSQGMIEHLFLIHYGNIVYNNGTLYTSQEWMELNRD